MIERDDPRTYEQRISDAVLFGISLRDRLELETIARASCKTVERYDIDYWRTLEFRSKVAEILIENGLEAKADRYMSCSLRVGILRCKGLVPHDFFSPHYCDLRFCQICGKRQFCRLRKKHTPVLDHIRSHPRRGFLLRRITLTSENQGRLDHDQIDRFNGYVKKTLRCLMKGVKGWGAIAALEVGFNNTNLHAHVLMWSPYIEQKALANVWREVSGNQVVWISSEENSGAAALSYLLKYVSKPPSDIPEMIGQLEVAFHGTRRIHCYGLFYGFSAGDPDAEDSHWTDCPKCGAPLERVVGSWDVHNLPVRGLEFIGSVLRNQEQRKWIN